jgi:sulfur-carrier protein
MVLMAEVTVKLFATVREAAGTGTVEMAADTIDELIQKLEQKFGARFREVAIDEESGHLKRFYSCMINGKRIELLDGYDSRLEEGDRVAIFPPVGGGTVLAGRSME